jgi:hypothetical protein
VEAHVGGGGGGVTLPLTINAAQSVFQSVAAPMPQSPQSPHTPRTHAPVLQATGGGEGQGTGSAGGQDDVPALDIATFNSGRPG